MVDQGREPFRPMPMVRVAATMRVTGGAGGRGDMVEGVGFGGKECERDVEDIVSRWEVKLLKVE